MIAAKDATDRARLHRALDAVLDGKKRAKDAEWPVYTCITKDGKKHLIEAQDAHMANSIAEKKFGYANIAVPPQESLRSPAKDDHISSVCTHCGGSGKVWNAGRHVMCSVCGGSGRSKNSYVVHGSANWLTAKDADAHVGMLGVNAEKAKQLEQRLKRQGFEYRFPVEPPRTDMVRHGFVKYGPGGGEGRSREWKTLNERKNGYHNITDLTSGGAKDAVKRYGERDPEDENEWEPDDSPPKRVGPRGAVYDAKAHVDCGGDAYTLAV